MDLYRLLRLLVKAAARTNGLHADEAYSAMRLIDRLEKVNALGTQVAINKEEITKNE